MIAPYTRDWEPAVRDFNQRMRKGAGGAEWLQFPESHVPERFPRDGDADLYEEQFLAVEDCVVRGGFILKRQNFLINGQVRCIAHYRLPLSEGLCNKAYVGVGMQMLREALKAEPFLFALGMGGMDRPLPRMLKAMGWSLFEAPFYFKVNHPHAFLRNLRALRTSAARRAAMDLAAFSGLGWAGLKAAHAWSGRNRPAAGAVVQRFQEFGAWADALWEDCGSGYAFIAVRDGKTMNRMYPASSDRFIRIQVSSGPRLIGWAVLLETKMRGHRQFGNMRVGTIVDGLCRPEDAPVLIDAAARELERAGVDIVISNQAHLDWGRGLRQSGFLNGPSNFVFAASRKLAEAAGPLEQTRARFHINRGDGDGPVHL